MLYFVAVSRALEEQRGSTHPRALLRLLLWFLCLLLSLEIPVRPSRNPRQAEQSAVDCETLLAGVHWTRLAAWYGLILAGAVFRCVKRRPCEMLGGRICCC